MTTIVHGRLEEHQVVGEIGSHEPLEVIVERESCQQSTDARHAAANYLEKNNAVTRPMAAVERLHEAITHIVHKTRATHFA